MDSGIIIYLIIFIILLTFATVLSRGKGAFLIAGYNTMSEQEKAAFDEVALCKFMGKIMYGSSLGILLLLLGELFELLVLFILGLILLVGLPIFSVFYINKGKQFKRK